jgi:hypothetical protein
MIPIFKKMTPSKNKSSSVGKPKDRGSPGRRQSDPSASLPLFLRASAVSAVPSALVQRQVEEEEQPVILDATETRDAVDFAPIVFDPSQTAGSAGRSVEIPAAEKYSAQFRQLEILIGDRSRARAVTVWAMNFFAAGPSIEAVAKALSKKVDDALFAVNRAEGFITWFDLTTWFEDYRKSIDWMVDLYLEQTRDAWFITYRVPRPVAVAMFAVEDVRGKCEEHAFLTIYLLSIGHMIQGMPFGQLKGDIYYTGAATEDHAMAILVKGAEFKDALKACIAETGRIDSRWLCEHTELWGANAWIADGWKGEAEKLSDNPVDLSWYMTQGFRRDPRDARKLPSEWDVTVLQMANRVARDYGIQ